MGDPGYLKKYVDPDLALFQEFDKLISYGMRWWRGDLKKTQRSSHLTPEDIRQTAYAALWEHRDEWQGLEYPERGEVAAKILTRGVGRMLTENAFFRSTLCGDLVPILDAREGYESGFSTADWAVYPEEDHADACDHLLSLAVLSERSREVIVMRRLGYTWTEIGDEYGITATSIKQALFRDLNRHGLLDFMVGWLPPDAARLLDVDRTRLHSKSRVSDRSK